jgi:hypothetical protein
MQREAMIGARLERHQAVKGIHGLAAARSGIFHP